MPIPLPSPTENLKETAEFFAEAVYLGLAEVDEVVAWCQQVMATHPEPPQAIAQTLGAARKGAAHVQDELWGMKGDYDNEAVYRHLFERMHALLRRDDRQAAKILAALAVMSQDYPPVSPAVYGEIEHFAAQASLFASTPYGHQAKQKAEVVQQCLDFLQQAAQGQATGYRPGSADKDALRKSHLRVTILFWVLLVCMPLLNWLRSGLALDAWLADIVANHWVMLAVWAAFLCMALGLTHMFYRMFLKKES